MFLLFFILFGSAAAGDYSSRDHRTDCTKALREVKDAAVLVAQTLGKDGEASCSDPFTSNNTACAALGTLLASELESTSSAAAAAVIACNFVGGDCAVSVVQIQKDLDPAVLVIEKTLSACLNETKIDCSEGIAEASEIVTEIEEESLQALQTCTLNKRINIH